MHDAVLRYVARWARGARSVLDLGGRDVNGTNRGLFPGADYTTVDITPGPGVDVVADARTWEPVGAFDLALCTEVLEHVEDWRSIVATAYQALRPGGRLVVTCAGPGRPPHSGRDAAPVPEPDEHYANIHPDDLAEALAAAGFVVSDCGAVGLDTQALAIRPLPSPFADAPPMTADPFPHVIADGLWPEALLSAVVAEFPDLRAPWRAYSNGNERKYEGGPDLWGPAVRTLFASLSTPEALDDLEQVTGIPDLSVEFVGGGYHLIPPGAGRLAVHTDFNRSPGSGRFRRLNALTYLNRGWDDPGGRLELWPDRDGEPVEVAPEFGRTVVFETSDRSWHGHPRPASRWRLSVAAYFFSPQPPPGYRADHSTVWRDDR